MTKLLVRDHMSASPHTIGRNQSVEHAAHLMREHHIRHLPVLDGGTLLGILSSRDLLLIESLKDVDAAEVTVEEALSPEPYAVTPTTPLVEVVTAMAEHKYGAAVVMEKQKVVGIFTTIDALRLLATFVG